MQLPGLVRTRGGRAQESPGRRRAGLVAAIVVVLVAATCVRLGVWQLDRLAQRRALNALAEARMAMPPVDAEALPLDSAGAAFRRARLSGSCEGTPIVLAARSRHGSPGVHLLCRFATRGGRAVLLDRGWLPSADARTVGPAELAHAPRDTTLEVLAVPFPPGDRVGRGTASRTIESSDAGVVVAPAQPRVIYRLNLTQARAVGGADLPAWYAQALGPDSILPIPGDPPDLGEGPHLGYAVQWFSFATIALVGWILLWWSGRTAADPARSDA